MLLCKDGLFEEMVAREGVDDGGGRSRTGLGETSESDGTGRTFLARWLLRLSVIVVQSFPQTWEVTVPSW